MSIEEAATLLSLAYQRAIVACQPTDRRYVRRAFRRALAELSAGDTRSTVLLSVRW